MTKRRTRSSGINWKSVGMGLFLFVVIAASFMVITGNNPFATNTADTTPGQQVKVSFSVVEYSNGSTVTSGTVRLWIVENGLYTSPKDLTVASDGTVTSKRMFNYGTVIAIQYRDHVVGTSMVHYTTPIQQYTVTFDASVDQGSTVYMGDISVKAITNSVSVSFQDADNHAISANYSTSDQGITVIINGLTPDSYFGGDDFVDYISTTQPEYEGGVFIVIKSSVEQTFADSPNLYAKGSNKDYYYYVFKFDQVFRSGSTAFSQSYAFPTEYGTTLNAGALYINIYDYYHVIGSDFSLSNFVSSRTITGYSGYIA